MIFYHIKIRHAYDFSLCFPPELLMSFLNIDSVAIESCDVKDVHLPETWAYGKEKIRGAERNLRLSSICNRRVSPLIFFRRHCTNNHNIACNQAILGDGLSSGRLYKKVIKVNYS